MKKSTLLLAFLLIATVAFSQYNYKFNYQAVVRNGAGALVPNGSNVSFRFSILESSATGTVLYAETQTATVNNGQGLVNLVIGNGTPTVGASVFSGNFQDLTRDKYLKVEVDPAGGTSYTNLGATQLQFVPYASHAFTATLAENGTVWSKSGSDISYTAGKVTVERSAPADHVMQVTQTGATAGGYKGAIYGLNNATGNTGIGVFGEQAGNGWGVYGKAGGPSGTGTGSGVWGEGPNGVTAYGTGSTPVSVHMYGFLKVGNTINKTAFQIPFSTTTFTNRALTYANQQSTDIIFITPISNSTSNVLPGYQLMWSTTTNSWSIWNASDDATPSSFPVGTGFNVLIIKQ